MPDKASIIKLIAEIEKLDVHAATVDQIERLISALMDGFSIHAFQIPKPQYIYRTRICEKPDNISQVTYPPAKYTTLGRANDLRKPRFYASIGRSVPFFELNPKVGDKIVLSVWKTKTDMWLNPVGFTKEGATLLNSKRQLDKIYSPAEHGEKLTETDILVNDFLTRWFVKVIPKEKSDYYKVTAAMANILLAGDAFAGLVYPTVKMFGNADNVVLDPAFVDRSLQLVSIEYFQITGNEGITFNTELLDTAVKWDTDGAIEWTGKQLAWKYPDMSKIKLKAENSDWINLDEGGNRIDPVPTNTIWKNPSQMGANYKNCYPMAFKASTEIQALGPKGGIDIKYSVIFDKEKGERFIALYIPRSGYAFYIAKGFVTEYNRFIEMATKDIERFTLTNAEGSESVEIKLLPDAKRAHIFSEEYIDGVELANQVAPGYQLVIDSQDPPPLTINYFFEPAK